MSIKDKWITNAFIVAGIMNMTVLVHSRLFTNTTIPKFDPVVMSNFGLLMIIIWGLAYISVARSYHSVKWLLGVFAIEKFIYGYIWINWLLKNSLSSVYKEDLMAGIFYTLYGINDWIFFIFFTWVFLQLIKRESKLA